MTTRPDQPHPSVMRAVGALCSRCGDILADVAVQKEVPPGYPRICSPCRSGLLRRGDTSWEVLP